ncbi:histone deacetylase 8-like isoform X2 [Corticium candelabrum]|uniref:histone deacetylase 8-like isoform X2 n=1 Tax=Corticium candelabrum TaxID=121492 RepID=UPI002E26BF9A|nr:histone deacetylase 8-like isoform X2 [Corticium candelabrum]
MAVKSVALVTCLELVERASMMPKVSERAAMVDELIQAYRITQRLRVIEAKPATRQELTEFHSRDYVGLLEQAEAVEDEGDPDKMLEDFGLCYDCPIFEDMYKYVCWVTGATLTAADCLLAGTNSVAINWTGGWHHAKRSRASGYCYVNDIVLGILRLQEKFDRILYVDLDLHHGDGVQEAFYYSNKVMTLSFHLRCPGFFPGSGDADEVGERAGRGYSVNVPLKSGVTDDQYYHIFLRVIAVVKDRFKADAIVCQCGADCLVGDPISDGGAEGFNLSLKSITKCVQHLMSWDVPLLVLGGGGYHLANTARCWTYLTAVLVSMELPDEIPDHKCIPLYLSLLYHTNCLLRSPRNKWEMFYFNHNLGMPTC